MEFETTFRFYAVENADFIGAYKAGSLTDGEPQIMFAMDFFTWTLKDEKKEDLTEAFKDGMLQTITHEFCHAMQEMLDKDFNELEVERILGAYRPTWNVFEANPSEEMPETVFSIADFLDWMDKIDAKTADDFKQQVNELFMAHRLWIESERENTNLKNKS